MFGRPRTERLSTFWYGLLSITEITEYKYFSLLKRSRELKYKSELNIVPLVLITEANSFV